MTAFIIEGYKSLQQPPGDTPNVLLARISDQLAAIAQGSPANLSSSPSIQTAFHPTNSTLRFNAFWFLSLALSLSCALSATLVQQWSRYYLQAIERRSAPHHRGEYHGLTIYFGWYSTSAAARIRSYLHEGIVTFKMSALVEVIPLLLHLSVFLFFAGLIEFLMPINLLIANITLVVALVGGVIYTIFTILPLLYRQCPYRTPVSGLCWRVWQLFSLVQYHKPEGGVQWKFGRNSWEYIATSGIPGKRDQTALQWVLESLTENRTLEAFVDGIPGFFYSDRRDLGYDPCEVFDGFLRKSPVQLGSKIGRLLQSCSSGALTKGCCTKTWFHVHERDIHFDTATKR